MCTVARRDFVLSLVGVKGTVCECNRSRGTNLTSKPNARATAPYVQAKIRARFGGMCGRACLETASINNESNVYGVPDWCGVRSFDPCVCAFQNWACIHVCRCALTVGARSMCSGSVLAAPLRAHIIIIVIIIIIFDGSLR